MREAGHQRVKIYDRKCPGLYVSITPAGVATFSFKFTDPATGKQRTGWLGVYNPETFTVEHARSKVYALKAMDPAALVEQLRQRKGTKAKHGKTVAEIIEARITWMQAGKEVRRRNASPDRKLAQRRQPFAALRQAEARQQDRERRDAAGHRRTVERHPRGQVRQAVGQQRPPHAPRGVGPLQMGRRGRPRLRPETCRPCFTGEAAQGARAQAGADENEIRIFWHGLDRDDLPWDRKTRLAIKFELVTMLRSGELLPAHRDELLDLDGDNPRFDVPAKRVKKRRVIEQPLSDLAIEIIREALASDDQQFVFESPVYPGQPIHRTAMATALRGTKHEKCKDKIQDAGPVRTARLEAVHAA